jgi:hypothetical protein
MIPKGKGLPCYADDATLNQIRGKAMVGHQSLEDVWTLLDHLLLLEHMLDEEVDPEDVFGPSGWRDHAEVISGAWDAGRLGRAKESHK